MLNIYLTIVLAPLVGSIVVGLAGNRLGRQLSHSITILGVAFINGNVLVKLKKVSIAAVKDKINKK